MLADMSTSELHYAPPIHVPPVHSPDFSIQFEPTKLLTLSEELSMLDRSGLRTDSMRLRAAVLMLQADRFDDVVACLNEIPSASRTAQIFSLLGHAYLGRENEVDNRLAVDAFYSAEDLASTAVQRSQALSERAKALRRLGRVDKAAALLEQALEVDLRNVNAFKRIAAIQLEGGQTAQLLQRCDWMIENGILHSRVLAARALALDALGRSDEALDDLGIPTFVARQFLNVPPQWHSLEAFNRDLSSEILKNPALRYGRYGVASEASWRVDQLLLTRSKVMPQLLELIRSAIDRYVEVLPDADLPFLRARPTRSLLRVWSVITRGEGHELWHVHQNGWLSGVYYVAVPDSIRRADDKAGCIELGRPDPSVPSVARPASGVTLPSQLIRPEPGMLLIFPSHAYHRTYPHRGDNQRICVAFDIVPQGVSG